MNSVYRDDELISQIGSVGLPPFGGKRTFGYLPAGKTRSLSEVKLPIHIISGVRPGPTVLVQGAAHGNEIAGSVGILNLLDTLDPKELSGTVIAVPVLNILGFETGVRLSPADGKDILACFPGNIDGSITEQISYHYFNNIVLHSDILIDFHQGGRTAYERYILIDAPQDANNWSSMEKKRLNLAVVFGLSSVAYFPPGTFAENQSDVLADNNIIHLTPELSGGTGWYANSSRDIRDAEQGILNILWALDMIATEPIYTQRYCDVYDAGNVVWKSSDDGLFIREAKFGQEVEAQGTYGKLINPYTGDLISELKAERKGTVIPSGQEWPTIGNTSVGILGDVTQLIDRESVNLKVKLDSKQQ